MLNCVGIDGGTVVVTDKAYNSLLENCYVQVSSCTQ